MAFAWLLVSLFVGLAFALSAAALAQRVIDSLLDAWRRK